MNAKTFYNVFGVNGSKSDIPETNASLVNLNQGFTDIYTIPLASGGKAPDREEFNGIFYLIFSHLYNLQIGKAHTYDSKLNYEKFCVVRGSDGYSYTCILENGPDTSAGAKDPCTTNGKAYWSGGKGNTIEDVFEQVNNIQVNVTDMLQRFNLHISNESNPHKVDKYDVGLGNLPNAKSDSTETNSSNSLATSKAVYNVMQFVNNNATNISTLFGLVADLTPTVSTAAPTPLTQEEIDEGLTLVENAEWIQILP